MENCRSDLAVSVLNVAMRNCEAKLADLRKVNEVIKTVKEKKNKIRFDKLGRNYDLVITGIGDASYKVCEKDIRGNLVL